MIKRDGCGRRISNLVQCQYCGWLEKVDEYKLPAEWTAREDGSWACDQCSEDDRPLLGAEYDEEFDPSTYDRTAHQTWLDDHSPNYGPDDIGRRAPCNGYFVA